MGSCFGGVIAHIGGLPWGDHSSQLVAALGEMLGGPFPVMTKINEPFIVSLSFFYLYINSTA